MNRVIHCSTDKTHQELHVGAARRPDKCPSTGQTYVYIQITWRPHAFPTPRSVKCTRARTITAFRAALPTVNVLHILAKKNWYLEINYILILLQFCFLMVLMNCSSLFSSCLWDICWTLILCALLHLYALPV